MPIRLAKVLCLVSMRRSAEWRNNWDFQSENITYCVIIHAIHYILWHENWLKYSNSLFNLSALRYLIARNEGGRNDTLWPKLVAVVAFSHPSITQPFVYQPSKHTSSTHQNWFTRMCDSVVTIVLSYGCDRFLFRFICCYFDCHLYWMRNNCSNWCNLPNAVTATAMLLRHFATELSTPQEKRHRTSIIDDNRIN